MRQRITAAVSAALVCSIVLMGARMASAEDVVWYKPMPGIIPAPATMFGLYSGADFRLVKGTCSDCPATPQALWYFRDELIAVPAEGVEVAGFTRGLTAQEDVKRWYATATPQQIQARPPLLWVGATHLTRDVMLTADDMLKFPDGRQTQFALVPKIKSNLSYYDASSKSYFRKRPLRLRGELTGNTFTARTLWPQDWAMDEKRLHPAPLLPDETLMALVRRHASARNETFEARLLWERTPAARPEARDWSGHAVIGLMLNGAQGDDDEAHGGHFAVVTGRQGSSSRRGEMADWIVNNFYTLGSFSEKGITAAMLPLDNYLADLNSGQSWYRPSYLLVAVLKQDRAAHAYQAAIARVYGHFYRHDFEYNHASANCTGISMDTLRTLGWDIPTSGPTSTLRALAAYPYQSIAERSFAAGKSAYDYLTQEQTRLYPAAAFDAAGRQLLKIAAGNAPGYGDAKSLGSLLREDLEALVFVRFPQLPSSRAFGSYPVASYDEYMSRVPADKSQWKIVPVDPRPFPPSLMEPDTQTKKPMPAWVPAAVALGVVGALIGAVSMLIARRRRMRNSEEKNKLKQ